MSVVLVVLYKGNDRSATGTGEGQGRRGETYSSALGRTTSISRPLRRDADNRIELTLVVNSVSKPEDTKDGCPQRYRARIFAIEEAGFNATKTTSGGSALGEF